MRRFIARCAFCWWKLPVRQLTEPLKRLGLLTRTIAKSTRIRYNEGDWLPLQPHGWCRAILLPQDLGFENGVVLEVTKTAAAGLHAGAAFENGVVLEVTKTQGRRRKAAMRFENGVVLEVTKTKTASLCVRDGV